MHPGLDEAHRAGDHKLQGVGKARLLRSHGVGTPPVPGALLPDDGVQPLEEGVLGLSGEEDGDEVPVVLHKEEDLLQHGGEVPLELLGGVAGEKLSQRVKELGLALLQHVVDVLVVGVKGAPVHVGPFGELPDGDGAQILFPQQLGEGLAQLRLGAADPAVPVLGGGGGLGTGRCHGGDLPSKIHRNLTRDIGQKTGKLLDFRHTRGHLPLESDRFPTII